MKLLIRAYNGQGRGSGFIKRFTFGSYSHVSFVFEIGKNVEEIESIQGKGVIVHEPHTHEDKNFDEYEAPISDEQILDAHSLAKSFIGAKYDWGGVYGFLIRRNRHSENKWFCSEFIAYILYKIGYSLSRREPYRETPTTVADSLRIIKLVGNIGHA